MKNNEKILKREEKRKAHTHTHKKYNIWESVWQWLILSKIIDEKCFHLTWSFPLTIFSSLFRCWKKTFKSDRSSFFIPDVEMLTFANGLDNKYLPSLVKTHARSYINLKQPFKDKDLSRILKMLERSLKRVYLNQVSFWSSLTRIL